MLGRAYFGMVKQKVWKALFDKSVGGGGVGELKMHAVVNMASTKNRLMSNCNLTIVTKGVLSIFVCAICKPEREREDPLKHNDGLDNCEEATTEIVRLRHTRGLEDLSPLSSLFSASSQFSFRKGNEVLGWRERERYFGRRKNQC